MTGTRTGRIPRKPSGMKVPQRPANESGGPVKRPGGRAAVIAKLRERMSSGGLPTKQPSRRKS